MTIELTTKSVIFWPTGAGKTPEEALQNAKVKALKVREYLEQTYGCQLGAPEFKAETGSQDIHIVPIRTTPAQLQTLEKVWSDDSHDGSIESDGKKFVEEVIKINDDVQQLKQNIPTGLEQLRSDIAILTNQVTQLVTVLRGAFAPQPMTPGPPPGNYI